MHPIPYRRPLQGKSRRAVVTCSLSSLLLSLFLFSWMRKTRSWAEDRTAAKHAHTTTRHRVASRCRASCDVHPWLGRNCFNRRASPVRGAVAVVPIRAISAFCAFVERQREEEGFNALDRQAREVPFLAERTIYPFARRQGDETRGVRPARANDRAGPRDRCRRIVEKGRGLWSFLL